MKLFYIYSLNHFFFYLLDSHYLGEGGGGKAIVSVEFQSSCIINLCGNLSAEMLEQSLCPVNTELEVV